MRVQTEEWRRFIPGVRMYKGKKTFFYNGETLWNNHYQDYIIYDKEERLSWEAIIVLPGVEVIPEGVFTYCKGVKSIIMADTVRIIKNAACFGCKSLKFVKLSRNLEEIERLAFCNCVSLESIFIPPLCRRIGIMAFMDCIKLIILSIPSDIDFSIGIVVGCTRLVQASPVETVHWHYEFLGIPEGADHHAPREWDRIREVFSNWMRTLNDGEQYEMHRVCASVDPSSEDIYRIMKENGLCVLQQRNDIGITPMQYLRANPFRDDVNMRKLVRKYIFEMMGEAVE